MTPYYMPNDIILCCVAPYFSFVSYCVVLNICVYIYICMYVCIICIHIYIFYLQFVWYISYWKYMFDVIWWLQSSFETDHLDVPDLLLHAAWLIASWDDKLRVTKQHDQSISFHHLPSECVYTCSLVIVAMEVRLPTQPLPTSCACAWQVCAVQCLALTTGLWRRAHCAENLWCLRALVVNLESVLVFFKP